MDHTRSTLTALTSVGSRSSIRVVIADNVIKLVERPNDAIEPTKSDVEATAKSWTIAEVVRRSEIPSGKHRKGFSRLRDSAGSGQSSSGCP